MLKQSEKTKVKKVRQRKQPHHLMNDGRDGSNVMMFVQ